MYEYWYRSGRARSSPGRGLATRNVSAGMWENGHRSPETMEEKCVQRWRLGVIVHGYPDEVVQTRRAH